MKDRIIAVLSFYCVLSANSGVAQAPPPFREPDLNRPKLFQYLPDTIPIEFEFLVDLVTRPKGYHVNLDLSNVSSFPFEGEIISTVSRYQDRIRSVVIRSANYPGAHFTLSRVKLDDGTIRYTGRILSFQHGDVFELRRMDEGYALIKKGFYQVVTD